METSGDPKLGLIGASLHQRLMSGDATAFAEIAEVFLPRIVYKLQKQFPDLYDPDLADTAADDALLNYLRRPEQYNPVHLSLERYLIMSARGDLLNLLSKGQYPGFPKKMQFVELDVPAPEYKAEVKDDSLSVEEQAFILASPVWQLLEKLLPDATDREVVFLMLEGVRETEEYSRVLGTADFTKLEQEAEVKRHKDRIKKLIQRHIHRSQLDTT